MIRLSKAHKTALQNYPSDGYYVGWFCYLYDKFANKEKYTIATVSNLCSVTASNFRDETIRDSTIRIANSYYNIMVIKKLIKPQFKIRRVKCN